MATIVKNTLKNGQTTYKAKVRRNGYPTLTQTFQTKPEALAWARLQETKIDKGEAAPTRLAADTTLRDVLERYKREVSPMHRGGDIEQLRIDRFLRAPMVDLSMSRITTSVLASYRDERLKLVSSGTALRDITLLRAIINRARNEWCIDIADPFARLTKPKAPPGRDRRLSKDEEVLLYEGCRAARNQYLKPAIEFALETAMRQGEIVTLEWRHVNFEKRTAKLLVTKNGHPRTVPLSSRAIEIINALPRQTELVFEGLRNYSIKHAFVRLTNRTKIDNLHFHDLRHEAISRLFERGLETMTVAAISGHRTLSMLQRYTHLKAEDIALRLV